MVVSQIISTGMLKLKLLNVHVHSSAYVYAECILNVWTLHFDDIIWASVGIFWTEKKLDEIIVSNEAH